MPSNELVELMKEYGVEVQMLGADEEPDPMSIKVVDMLTEIHDLRTRLVASRQPSAVSDEELDQIWKQAADAEFDRQMAGPRIPVAEEVRQAGIAAIRAALQSPVQVPEWVDRIDICKMLFSETWECELYQYGELPTIPGDPPTVGEPPITRFKSAQAPTWQAALAAAIEQAQEDGK